MWPEFIHHVTSHFALALPWVLAAAGLYAMRTDESPLIPLLRWGGWATFAMALITTATGLIGGGFTGGEEHLQHHRYLGILTFITVAVAAVGYEVGVRRGITDLRKFGVGVWWVASFATIGAGHWGVLAEHADVVPF